MEKPTLDLEKQYWQQGVELIAGVDEVGMGAWAGPVCAAAVIYCRSEITNNKSSRLGRDPAAAGQIKGPAGVIPGGTNKLQNTNSKIQTPPAIRDSKTLSAKQRERAFDWVKENCVAWGIGEASVEEISRLNIRRASHLAMRRAVDGMKARPELLLVDGTSDQIHELIPAVSVVDGDSLSLSIASASILAKVYRDRLMAKLDRECPGYGLAQHKGYGTKQHKEALMNMGATPHHRPTYAPVAEVLKG